LRRKRYGRVAKRHTEGPGVKLSSPLRWFSLLFVTIGLYLGAGCSAAEDPPGRNNDLNGIKESKITAAKPAVGLNKFDLFVQYLGHTSWGREGDYSQADYQRVTRAMAEKAIVDARDIGVTYLRVSATGYHPATFRSSQPSDLSLWRDDPSAYWALFDQMMADLRSHDVRIVPVFLWNWTQFASMTGESADQMINDPDSDSYRLLKAYVAEFVHRYKDHPALYFYELTNELNLQADLDVVERCANAGLPDPTVCEPMSNFSTDEMIGFTGRLAAHVRSLDPSRPISSGFSLPRPNAEHLRRSPEFAPGGPDFEFDSLAEFKKNLTDIHSGVDVVSVHFYNRRYDNDRLGITGHTNAALLDRVKQIADGLDKELFVGEFGDVKPYIKDDKRALFTQNVLDKIVELKIPYSAPWVWEFYERSPYSTYDNPNTFFNLEPGHTDLIISKIKDANADLGNFVPSPKSPDTTPPRVIVTWPLEGQMSCNQMVHAVASDEGEAVSRVRFLVDGDTKATVSTPPYRFELDAVSLGFGGHRITAEGYDRAGNVGRFAVSVRSPLCIRERLSRLVGSTTDQSAAALHGAFVPSTTQGTGATDSRQGSW
jgi:hypothetical protein